MIEGSGAVGIAALLHGNILDLKGKNVVTIVNLQKPRKV
jgi:threonine dehydratase